MSWQRIDENTYIDDTLVTCAEYQLFIDEMHEQGKYYQPDHWTAYQFPKGQAREPILGVRQSDALAFCEWLGIREVSEWRYRLPIQKEASTFPLVLFGESPFGYWIGEDYRFTWVGTIPEDARALNLTNALDLRSYPLARTRALDLSNYSGFDLDRDPNRDIVRSLTIAREFALARSRARARTGNFPRFHSIDLDRDLDMALDIYIDIFTLQERIAGRSPAFEGIRLVKERIK